jgi:hypothetical protein
MKRNLATIMVWSIPWVLSPLVKNIYKHKKNLPLEKNIFGRLIKRYFSFKEISK